MVSTPARKEVVVNLVYPNVVQFPRSHVSQLSGLENCATAPPITLCHNFPIQFYVCVCFVVYCLLTLGGEEARLNSLYCRSLLRRSTVAAWLLILLFGNFSFSLVFSSVITNLTAFGRRIFQIVNLFLCSPVVFGYWPVTAPCFMRVRISPPHIRQYPCISHKLWEKFKVKGK